MYTQCPHCRTAFQVTPAHLRRAHGTVRCGQCGELFDAIEHLSPEPPVQGHDEPVAPRDGEPPSLEPRDAAAEPVTGVSSAPEPCPEAAEEPVPTTIAEPEPEPEPTPAGQAVQSPAAAGEPDDAHEPQRFDDDTPLEEILASLGEDFSEPAADAAEPPQASSPPTDQAETAAEPDVEPGSEIDDRDDWRSLLAELDLEERSPPAEPADETPVQEAAPPSATAAETAATGSEPEPEITVVESDRGPVEEIVLGADGLVDAEITPVAGEWILVDEFDADESDEAAETVGPAEGSAEQDEKDDAFALSGVLFDELVQSGEFEGLLAATAPAADTDTDNGAGKGDTAADGDAGAAARAAAAVAGLDELAEPDSAADRLAQESVLDEEEERIDAALIERRATRPGLALWSAAAVLLTLVLGAQVIHGQRASLATLPEFGTRLQSLYGALGLDLEPYWDIGALCVEASSGDASTNTLEISSVIVHRGDRPQPYPVLQVALTDRWQSVIGSRTVEAADYLPPGELRDVKIRPGDRVRARARLADPGSEAAGYELHVCYPEGENGLRCSGACL